MPTQRPNSPVIVFGTGALALLGVIALFQVVLEPPERIPCSTELAPGTFRETLLIYIAIPALLICTLVVLRWLRDPAERRAALVTNARTALWLGLTVALPANLAVAWLSGVSLFCF